MKKPEPEKFGAHSRRTFFKSPGTVAAELEKAGAEKVAGPDAVPVTLTVNGENGKLSPVQQAFWDKDARNLILKTRPRLQLLQVHSHI